MKRTYYLVQTLEEAKQLQTSLVNNNVAVDRIHMMCKDDSRLAPMGLNELPLTQRKDIFADIEYGGLLGILIGLLAALAMIALPTGTIELTPVLFSGIVYAVGITGLVAGALIGMTRENYHISEFRAQILNDQCVVMIDSDNEQGAQLAKLLSNSGVSLQYLKEDDDELHLEAATEGVPMTT